jgi:hypothetical protein
MNYYLTIAEIGPLETIRVLNPFQSDNKVMDDVSQYLPMKPGFSPETRALEAACELIALGKNKLLFTSFDLAIIEALGLAGWNGEVIVVMPLDMDAESVSRIKGNVPANVNVTFIDEGCYPDDFTISNGALVSVGFASGNHCLILATSYRLMQLHQSFYGEKVLVSCFEEGVCYRAFNWIPASTYQIFTTVLEGVEA